MKHMVNDFRDYAKTPPPTLAPLDLNALVREMLQLYEADQARLRQAELRRTCRPSWPTAARCARCCTT